MHMRAFGVAVNPPEVVGKQLPHLGAHGACLPRGRNHKPDHVSAYNASVCAHCILRRWRQPCHSTCTCWHQRLHATLPATHAALGAPHRAHKRTAFRYLGNTIAFQVWTPLPDGWLTGMSRSQSMARMALGRWLWLPCLPFAYALHLSFPRPDWNVVVNQAM